MARNLSNPIWHKGSDTIIGGAFSAPGYFQFGSTTCPYPASPDKNAGDGTYGTMVQLPAVGLLVHTRDFNPSPASEIYVAPLSAAGVVGAFNLADFGANPPTQCNLISSSWDELLCLQPPLILHYKGTPGSSVLTLSKTVTLSQALNDPCDAACWGASFAFDGAYYYFAFDGNVDDTGLDHATYEVYDASGTYVDTHSSAGALATGRVNGLYFDWSVGRYAVYDGYAQYGGGTLHTPDCALPPSSAYNDTQVYGPVSANHQ